MVRFFNQWGPVRINFPNQPLDMENMVALGVMHIV